VRAAFHIISKKREKRDPFPRERVSHSVTQLRRAIDQHCFCSLRCGKASHTEKCVDACRMRSKPFLLYVLTSRDSVIQ